MILRLHNEFLITCFSWTSLSILVSVRLELLNLILIFQDGDRALMRFIRVPWFNLLLIFWLRFLFNANNFLFQLSNLFFFLLTCVSSTTRCFTFPFCNFLSRCWNLLWFHIQIFHLISIWHHKIASTLWARKTIRLAFFLVITLFYIIILACNSYRIFIFLLVLWSNYHWKDVNISVAIMRSLKYLDLFQLIYIVCIIYDLLLMILKNLGNVLVLVYVLNICFLLTSLFNFFRWCWLRIAFWLIVYLWRWYIPTGLWHTLPWRLLRLLPIQTLILSLNLWLLLLNIFLQTWVCFFGWLDYLDWKLFWFLVIVYFLLGIVCFFDGGLMELRFCLKVKLGVSWDEFGY